MKTATHPTIEPTLTLDRSPPDYSPADAIRFEATLPEELASMTQSAELSILWHTAGKGEEDLCVLAFRRVTLSKAAVDGPVTLDLQGALPASPLSYAGRIVKVCWCARLRLHMAGGRLLLRETPLRLGSVPPADGPGDG